MNEEESIVLDPVGMNIVNRIAPGSRVKGSIEFHGGVMVEGEFHGKMIVHGGPLVLMQTGVISGDIQCDADVYLFGNIAAQPDGELSELVTKGSAFMTQSLDAKANVTAAAVKMFEGAQVVGRIRTVRKDKSRKDI